MSNWEYVIFRNGYLWSSDGCKFLQTKFENEFEAEEYLCDNDIRATILN